MAEITPKQAAGALEAVAAALPDALRDAAGHGALRIGGYAVDTFMRDAKGEGRRSPGDSGPLRIVSGRLARAVASTPDRPHPGGVNRITTDPASVLLEKGVDLGVVPYARIHERGGTAGRGARIPARPYLSPALDAAAPEVQAYAQEKLTQLLADAVGHRVT